MRNFWYCSVAVVCFVVAVSCATSDLENLAVNRLCTASSSYDNNLTAQLATDGILSEGEPVYMSLASSEGVVGKDERECTLDGDMNSRNILTGRSGWLEYEFHGYSVDADEAELLYALALEGGRSGEAHRAKLPVHRNDSTGALRIDLKMPKEGRWRVKNVDFRKNGQSLGTVLPSGNFYSAWMSEGLEDEWLELDMGAVLPVRELNLHWGNRARNVMLELSKDGKNWRSLSGGMLDCGKESLDCRCRARYVRVNMSAGTENGKPYCIKELEVLGPCKASRAAFGGWKVQRASQLCGNGQEFSALSYDASAWLPASVPATTLQNYIDAGAVPDPDYGDNWSQISESFFLGDFWYRYEFESSRPADGRHCFVDFDGVNWKAELYMNSQYVGRIDGAFMRGHFDITPFLNDGANVLAVKVLKPANPGAVKVKNAKWTGYNGGVLGKDNPTFMASIGWDWMTTVRGRNCGIWDDVSLNEQGAAGVSDPLVQAEVSENGLATITASIVLKENERFPSPVEVEGWLGDIHFSKLVSQGGEVVFSPQDFPQLKDCNLELWWPNNYGRPNLHEAGFAVKVNGELSDSLHFKAGIRQISSVVDNGALKLYVNGRRFIPLGGNWGFSQQNLKYSAQQYDTAVQYHQQMNFNMIRNWVGQTGDKEFYEACDRYGIMVWQDFWLANPLDGQEPADEKMFLDNAKDLVRKIRRHPSVALYCGRNEGYPPASLDQALKNEVTAVLHPDILYISSSADGPVSGRGPYHALPTEYYFTHQSGKLHSERGMPNVPNYESMLKMMPEEDIWQNTEMWGKHDFTRDGAQMGRTYMGLMEKTFGECKSGQEFCSLAQWLNYDGYRAMFEAANSGGRMGLLLWMSHSCWPSLCWCTYDYYMQPGGAFFGSKKGCEPLHIQYNPVSRKVEVVNHCAGDQNELVVKMSLYDYTGKPLGDHVGFVNIGNDSIVEFMDVPELSDASAVYYLELTLCAPNWHPISTNFYFLSTRQGSLEALKELPEPNVLHRLEVQDNTAMLVLKNDSDNPALMLRVIAKDSSGNEILPIEYTENYFSILPHKEKVIYMWWPEESFKGVPEIEVRHAFQYSN